MDGVVLGVRMASALFSSFGLLINKGRLAGGPFEILEYHSWFFFLLQHIEHSLLWQAVQGIMA